MHMADALVSPVVGGLFWAAAAGAIACCSARVRRDADDRKVPLMGVLGAFVFAAQMINFTIPATGSSGHLGGGLLLAILLGPSAAFLTLTSVLMVQALFFADGGLLALGCNIFNLGFFPAFIAYPFVYQKLVGRNPCQTRVVTASIVAAVVALQFGSLGVVLQTVASGVSGLPLKTFLLLMQPIHLGIGIVEGVVTALVISFIYQARPEILENSSRQTTLGNLPTRSLLATFLIAAVLIGGVLSWFASEHPDGLEWSIARITGSAGLPQPGQGGIAALAKLQAKTTILADYALPTTDGPRHETGKATTTGRLGSSLSGIVGGTITLVLCTTIGILLRKRNPEQNKQGPATGPLADQRRE